MKIFTAKGSYCVDAISVNFGQCDSFLKPLTFSQISFLIVCKCYEYASDAVHHTVSLVLQNVWLIILQFGATRSITLSNTLAIELSICKTNGL